jgi:hypothetical protein
MCRNNGGDRRKISNSVQQLALFTPVKRLAEIHSNRKEMLLNVMLSPSVGSG